MLNSDTTARRREDLASPWLTSDVVCPPQVGEALETFANHGILSAPVLNSRKGETATATLGWLDVADVRRTSCALHRLR